MKITKLNYIDTDPINSTSGCLIYYMDDEAFKKFEKMTDKEIRKEFDYESYNYYEDSKIDGGYIVFMYGEDEYDEDDDYDDEDDDYDDEDED